MILSEKSKVKCERVEVKRGTIKIKCKSSKLTDFCVAFILLLFLMWSGNAWAQEMERPKELQVLNDYFQIAVEHNPELESLRLEIEAQRERVPQVRSLPDPEFSVGFYLNPMTDTNPAERFSFQAMQMFPWFGTLETRGEIEALTAESRRYSLSERELKIFSEIQDLWFLYFKLEHHVHVNHEILQIVRDLERLVQARYESGQRTQADILRLQMEEQRILNTIDDLEDNKNPVRERFNALLNRPSGEEITVPFELPSRDLLWNKEDLMEWVQAQHPAYDRLQAERNRYQKQEELARLEGRPSFGIGLDYMGRNFGMMSMMDLDPVVTGMATIRIPLYRGKYKAQQKEARLRLQSTHEQETDLNNWFKIELEDAMKSYRESKRKYELITEELLPRTRQIFNIYSEEYSTGDTTFEELIEIVRELLVLENEKVEALAQQNEALSAIEQLIAVEFKSNE